MKNLRKIRVPLAAAVLLCFVSAGASLGAERLLCGWKTSAVETKLREIDRLVSEKYIGETDSGSVADYAAVGLDLALAGTAARSRAAPLPLEVRPHARKPGQQILALRELDLRFRIGRRRPLDEYVQNQARAVVDLVLEHLVQIAKLRRRKLVVENHVAYLVLLDEGRDLGELALAYESLGRRGGQPLREPLDATYAGRLGQKFQFVEVFGHLRFVLPVVHNGDQYGPTLLRRRIDRFSHESFQK